MAVLDQPISSKGDSNDIKSRLKYSRSELILVGKSLELNDKSFSDLLNSLNTIDWTQFVSPILLEEQSDKIQIGNDRIAMGSFKPAKLVRSVTSFGRQNSGFFRADRKSSLINNNVTNIGQNHKTKNDIQSKANDIEQIRLTRMISSPHLKWSRGARSNDTIVNSKTNTGTTMNNNDTNIKVDRLLGNNKLKKLDITQTKRRRESDISTTKDFECSLPCSINSDAKSSLADEFLRSPVVRLTSDMLSLDVADVSAKSSKSKKTKEDKRVEDEFDITNLLNLTVLSDIKTIKQETKKVTSDNSNHKLQEPLKHTTGSKNKVQGAVMRHLGRAKTFTDYQRKARPKLNKLTNGPTLYEPNHSGVFYGAETYNWVMNQPESLPYTADYSIASSVSSRRSSVKPKLVEKTKQMDENTKQIIESFKREVLARARAPSPIEDKKEKEKSSEDINKRNFEADVSKPKVDTGAQKIPQASRLPRLISLTHSSRVKEGKLESKIEEESKLDKTEDK